ncbi:hypothetical protein Tco_1237160 [Tanacetum coccineum]
MLVNSMEITGRTLTLSDPVPLYLGRTNRTLFWTQESSHTSSPLDHHSSSVHHGITGEQYTEINPFTEADPEPFVNVFATDYNSKASSSREITIHASNQSTQPHEHIRKWTDSHPLDNIIGNPQRTVSHRKTAWIRMHLWRCFYNSVLSKVDPIKFQSAATETADDVYVHQRKAIVVPRTSTSCLSSERKLFTGLILAPPGKVFFECVDCVRTFCAFELSCSRARWSGDAGLWGSGWETLA